MTATKTPWAKHADTGNMVTRGLDNVRPLAPFVTSGKRLLDVGSGPGAITAALARLASPGQVVGLDAEPRMVERAAAFCVEQGLSNTSFVQGDAHELPFESASFDVVLSHAVLDWLVDPLRALREQLRVLKPGGVVFTNVSDMDSAVLYPECPAVMQILKSVKLLSAPFTTTRAEVVNFFLGKHIYELFALAGAERIVLEPWSTCRYQGNEPLKATHALPFWPFTTGVFAAQGKRLQKLGALPADLVAAADAELEAWVKHPHAVVTRSGLFVTGFRPA